MGCRRRKDCTKPISERLSYKSCFQSTTNKGDQADIELIQQAAYSGHLSTTYIALKSAVIRCEVIIVVLVPAHLPHRDIGDTGTSSFKESF